MARPSGRQAAGHLRSLWSPAAAQRLIDGRPAAMIQSSWSARRRSGPAAGSCWAGRTGGEAVQLQGQAVLEGVMMRGAGTFRGRARSQRRDRDPGRPRWYIYRGFIARTFCAG